MKKVTQVSPRNVSPTESRVPAARLARRLARLQVRGTSAGAPCVSNSLNASGLPDGAEEALVSGDAGIVPGRRRAPRHLDIVLEHEDVRAVVRHLLLQHGVLLGAFAGVELACRRQHLLGDLGDEPLVAP